MFVNVVVPPVIIDFGPTIHTVIKGEAVQLKCQAAGTPMPTIKWQKNGMSFKMLYIIKSKLLLQFIAYRIVYHR